jgi:CheY-like chemotaxis protein
MTASKWILLAEDNPRDADLAMRALAVDEAEVIVARDGAEVLDCLHRRGEFRDREAGQPVVVLLDLKMPKVDGLEVLRQIKADTVLKPIPVVVFTSSREESDLVRCYQLGANAYVVKPVGFQEFATALKEVRAFWMGINEPPPQMPVKPNSIQRLENAA